MSEFFLPFLIGYATCRILSSMLSAKVETSYSNDSLLLKWNNDIFGWRSAIDISKDLENQRYVLAKPVSKELAFLITESRKNDV